MLVCGYMQACVCFMLHVLRVIYLLLLKHHNEHMVRHMYMSVCISPVNLHTKPALHDSELLVFHAWMTLRTYGLVKQLKHVRGWP